MLKINIHLSQSRREKLGVAWKIWLSLQRTKDYLERVTGIFVYWRNRRKLKNKSYYLRPTQKIDVARRRTKIGAGSANWKKKGYLKIMRNIESKLRFDLNHGSKAQKQKFLTKRSLLPEIFITLKIHERLYLQYKWGSGVNAKEDSLDNRWKWETHGR